MLLDNNASMTATTKKGFTPLHLASKYGRTKIATILLQRGAPVDAQGKVCVLERIFFCFKLIIKIISENV